MITFELAKIEIEKLKKEYVEIKEFLKTPHNRLAYIRCYAQIQSAVKRELKLNIEIERTFQLETPLYQELKELWDNMEQEAGYCVATISQLISNKGKIPNT